MASKLHTGHPLLSYVFTRSKLKRHEIAKKLGISRQTIYDWEYGVTPYKPYMLEDVLEASGFDIARIPQRRFQEADEMDARRDKGLKPKEPPHQPKSDYDAQGKAQKEREARQEAKANDPKRHRIRNYGVPTEANKNPYTFGQVSSGMTKIKSKGVDIPSDMEYPDMVSAALNGLGCYEAVFVERHLIPSVTGNAHSNPPYTCGTFPGFYWTLPNGRRSTASTLTEANAMMAKQIAEDEAATADLI